MPDVRTQFERALKILVDRLEETVKNNSYEYAKEITKCIQDLTDTYYRNGINNEE